MKKNKTCEGNIYKINGKTYCIGEKKKKTKKRINLKVKRKSKKSLGGSMKYFTKSIQNVGSTITSATRAIGFSNNSSKQIPKVKPVPKQELIDLDELNDFLIEVPLNNIILSKDVESDSYEDIDLKDKQNQIARQNFLGFVSKKERYLFYYDRKYYTIIDGINVKKESSTIIKIGIEKYHLTWDKHKYNNSDGHDNDNPEADKVSILYKVYKNRDPVKCLIVPTKIYEKESIRYYALDDRLDKS